MGASDGGWLGTSARVTELNELCIRRVGLSSECVGERSRCDTGMTCTHSPIDNGLSVER